LKGFIVIEGQKRKERECCYIDHPMYRQKIMDLESENIEVVLKVLMLGSPKRAQQKYHAPTFSPVGSLELRGTKLSLI
jgi:hypothetical protein